MKQQINELEINGEKYVLKSSVQTNAPVIDGMPLVLIRGYGSGVQYGYLAKQDGCMVTLINSRRIWSWNKATECSQIAVDGIDASSSKVTVICPEKVITDAIEIITITSKAAENLLNQPVWKK
jgi:hypothetical protein